MLTPTPTTLTVLPVPTFSVSSRMSLPEPLIPRHAPSEQNSLPEEQRTPEGEAFPESYISWLVGIQELLTALANRNEELRHAEVTADEYAQLSTMIEDLMWAVGDTLDNPFAPIEGCVGSFMISYEKKHVPKLDDLFPPLQEEEDPALEETLARLAAENQDIHVPTEEEIAIDAFFSLGSLLAEAGKPENAIAAYDVAIRLKPDYAAAHCNRGNAHYAHGTYTAALRDYTTAICLNPERSEAYFNRAMTHFQLQNYTAAVRDYDASLTRNPDDADAILGRAHANFAMHRYEAAIQDYEAVLRCTPTHAEARRYRDIAHAQATTGNARG